jgi:alkanesulfonate monooxygenase SsuD/methylene tetrahydromethanopterin reductase-like flavin-dependent oxidoreductase (luciferase family)
MEILGPLLRGDALSYDGAIFTTRGAALGRAAPKAGVPIYVAALMPRMCRLAGELADGVLFNWTASAYLPEAVQQVRDGARRAGRAETAVDIAGYVRVAVTRDEERARAALQRQIAGYARNPFYRDFFAASGFSDEMAAVSEAVERGDVASAARAVSVGMQDAVAVVGPPGHCRGEIERRRTLGLGLPVVAPFAAGDVKESYVATMEAFAR